MQHEQLKNYDDDYLVDEIAKGELSYARIGDQTGLSKDHVGRIARGEFRPELHERIQVARRAYVERARDLCARLAWPAVQRLGALIASSEVPAEVQRRAAMDVLSMPLGDPADAEGEGRARMIRVECTDGVIVLPADMFIDTEDDTDWQGNHVAWRAFTSTRTEYLRIVSARVEPGTPKLLSRPEDFQILDEVFRARGEEVSCSDLCESEPTLPGFPPFAHMRIRNR
ncbi:MAG: hypothetical protein ACYS5V_07140 [Planctomycetota bacterium]|jgi:hypothetical protein